MGLHATSIPSPGPVVLWDQILAGAAASFDTGPQIPGGYVALEILFYGRGDASAATTVSLAGKVPSWARVAILTVELSGGTNSGSYQKNQVDFRRDSNSQICASVASKSASNGATTDLAGLIATVWVPLTATQAFDYQKNDTTNQGSSGAVLNLIGWL